MKIKSLLSFALAGFAVSAMAQTHAEGVEYYEADQLQNAKELLERNHNNSGTDKAVSDYYRGLIELRNDNPSQAAKFFNEGAEINPDYPYNFVGLGRIELKSGDPKIAQKLFKQAEGLGKKDPGVQIAIARAYDAVDPDKYAPEIEKLLTKARKTDIKDPASYIFEGDRLARERKYGEAGAKYEMALNYDPNSTAAYVKYANLYTQVNPQYGVDKLKELIRLNPNSALGQRQLADAYYRNNQYAEAAAQYGAYVKNPNHFKQDEDRYAFLLFYGQKYQEGYDYSSALLKANPNNFTARRYQFMNAAQLPSMKEQLLPMAEALYAAHQADPKANVFAPIDYTLISEEFIAAKQPQKAVEVLKDAVATSPDNANFYKQLAMAYVEAEDMPGAARAYAGYIQHSEKPGYNDMIQAALFDYFAAVQTKTSDPEASDKYFVEAAQYTDRAAELYPAMYKPLKIQGDIAMQRAPKEQVASAALEYYLNAIQKLEAMEDTSRYGSDAKTMYNYVGNYYLDQKNKEEAKKYFNQYLKYDPNNNEYRNFVNSL